MSEEREVCHPTMYFTCVVGVRAGYAHGWLGRLRDWFRPRQGWILNRAAQVWGNAAAWVYRVDGIYVPAVILPGRVVYSTEWGCPPNGEDVIVFQGHGNPKFVKDSRAWRAAVVQIVRRLKEELGQRTVTVYFGDGTYEDMR